MATNFSLFFSTTIPVFGADKAGKPVQPLRIVPKPSKVSAHSSRDQPISVFSETLLNQSELAGNDQKWSIDECGRNDSHRALFVLDIDQEFHSWTMFN